jgi:hypothetical protein
MIILCLNNFTVYSKISKKEEESQWLKSVGGKEELDNDDDDRKRLE